MARSMPRVHNREGEASTAAVEIDDTDSLGPSERVPPTRTDPLVRQASQPIGGPLGEHASVGRQWFWTPLRVVLLLASVGLILGWFGKAACIQQYEAGEGQLELDWRANRPFVAMCYSDIIPLYSAEQLDKSDTFPYRTSWIDDEGKPTAHERYMEYPVFTGLFQWVNAKLAHGWASLAASGWLPSGLTVAIYFNISAFWLAVAWLVTIWALVRTSGRRPWDVALAALSPLVFVHAFTNFDALATAFAATGMLAWARKRPALAGVLLGLGAAAKLYPLFLLGPLFVLCLRAGKLKAWGITAVTAGGAWLAVNLPIALSYPRGWLEFFKRNSERAADPDSLYNVVMQFTGWAGFDGDLTFGETPTWLNLVSAALFVVCCVGIAYVGLSAPTRPRFAQLAFLVVAAFLLTNKVWSPQYSLWLVPLAVLALPQSRLLLAWMAVDALVWLPRMAFYLGVDNKGLPVEWFLGTVVVRDLAVVGLCALVIYNIYRPSRDLVRATGDDDPTGGVLDQARDKFRFDRKGRRVVREDTLVSADHAAS
jgi:uncharacterized membrane protein